MKASCTSLLSPLFLASILEFAAPSKSSAQPFSTMRTGSGDVLLSQFFSYQNSAPSVSLEFGFATMETVAPSQFYDSFTVSVTGPGGIAYLLTADASGVDWAPFVPGAIAVASADIARQQIPFSVPTEGGQPIGSYEFDFKLPSSWVGVPLTVEFDLFDNQNDKSSLGYYAVPLPEPANTGLLLLGIAAFWYSANRCKRS
jgi:hypothetical protein